MVAAGLDLGSRTTKVVVMEDGVVAGKSIVVSPENVEEGARSAIDRALDGTGRTFNDVSAVVTTGAGRNRITWSNSQKRGTLSCLGKGAAFLVPSVRTVFDIGGETSTVLRINEKGLVEQYQGHDRCASGTGVFLESVAGTILAMPLDEMAKLSLEGETRAEISNMCAVFAEQEVISHIHRVPPTPINDIIRGVHGSMAIRIAGLGKRIGIKPDVMVCGGVGKNVGFVHELELELKLKVIVPEDSQLVAALGAALSVK